MDVLKRSLCLSVCARKVRNYKREKRLTLRLGNDESLVGVHIMQKTMLGMAAGECNEK